MLDGLLIRSPWVELILGGSKTWEIRGNRTTKRGCIALIKSGTGCVTGVVELVGVVGPLSLSELKSNAHKAGFAPSDVTRLPYRNTYAWVMENARPLCKPVSYSHPYGAVIWVRLPNNVQAAVFEQLPGPASARVHGAGSGN